MLMTLPPNRTGADEATPPEVAVVGLIQSERELSELSDMQAIQRWVCYLNGRLNPSKSVRKAF